MFALAGLRPHRSLPAGPDGRVFFTLPRSIIAAIMLVLRPAESCVRRLILIAAHGLKTAAAVRSAANSARLADLPPRGGDVRQDRGGRAGRKAFHLFDPLKSFDPDAIWDAEPKWDSGIDFARSPQLENSDEPITATDLGQRLNTLLRALDTIPHQARRLIRWQIKRDQLLKARKPTRLSPMRPGLPPGWRKRRLHEVDDVLRECHGLAHDRLNEP